MDGTEVSHPYPAITAVNVQLYGRMKGPALVGPDPDHSINKQIKDRKVTWNY